MLYAWGLLAWVILVTHQRLNVKHSITSFFFRRSNINNTKYIKEDLYDDLFYSWLIGFTEAKGSFFFFFAWHPGQLATSWYGREGCGVPGMGEEDITHKFKIKKNLPGIVFIAVGRILGIRINLQNTYKKIITANSRAITNIIKYFRNTMKGLKSFEYRV